MWLQNSATIKALLKRAQTSMQLILPQYALIILTLNVVNLITDYVKC
jgi:hypothetical protein